MLLMIQPSLMIHQGHSNFRAYCLTKTRNFMIYFIAENGLSNCHKFTMFQGKWVPYFYMTIITDIK